MQLHARMRAVLQEIRKHEQQHRQRTMQARWCRR
jgi:hypothetical protein